MRQIHGEIGCPFWATTRRAEMYKRNLQILIDEEYKFGWAGTALGYPWNASDYSIMAQINESLAN